MSDASSNGYRIFAIDDTIVTNEADIAGKTFTFEADDPDHSILTSASYAWFYTTP